MSRAVNREALVQQTRGTRTYMLCERLSQNLKITKPTFMGANFKNLHKKYCCQNLKL